MDVSIKGIGSDVVARLAVQAAVEGVSAQEWMRETLRRRAALLTPRELEAAVGARTSVSRERHSATMTLVNSRRATAIGKSATRVRNSGS